MRESDTKAETEIVTDVLGEQWLAETIPLEPDFEGEVVATLISRQTESPSDRATLHVHGFSDYFFHAEYGEWWVEHGHDMYGLDLRKYGRSIRPHQSATYVADLADYFEELDAAWERITVRDGHTQVVVSAHSTGGLVVALWADARKPEQLAGLVLNSPWLDLQGPSWLRSAPVTAVIDRLGRLKPMRELTREVAGFYGRSLHHEHEGEWVFDLAWKPLGSFPVRLGWLRAIRQGHAQVQRGLAVPAPVLVLSSDRSSAPREMCDDVFSTDIVLDVRQIRRWSTAIGPHVTNVMVPGAVHDVVLSRPAARAQAYDQLERWLAAYVGERPH
ncbi:MAG TPA: alpha/beta hydrolase [Nocardioides sp.]|nr:alpha/beta hydrolase [Nocardioides sp.]